jgi:hypothetical protein
MEIRWTDCVRNKVEHRVKKDRCSLYTIKGRNANWNGYILRKNCFLKHVIKGKIEGKEIRGRRHKQLLDDFKGKRRY